MQAIYFMGRLALVLVTFAAGYLWVVGCVLCMGFVWFWNYEILVEMRDDAVTIGRVLRLAFGLALGIFVPTFAYIRWGALFHPPTIKYWYHVVIGRVPMP